MASGFGDGTSTVGQVAQRGSAYSLDWDSIGISDLIVNVRLDSRLPIVGLWQTSPIATLKASGAGVGVPDFNQAGIPTCGRYRR